MIIAVTRLHYGKDYLWDVIKSTEGFADKHLVLYTPVSTFSQHTDLPCPDNRAELLAIAQDAGGARLDWREGLRVAVPTAFTEYPQADLYLELDADEVLSPELKADILARKDELTAAVYRLPFAHFWRNFNTVCLDASWPTRIFIPNNENKETAYWPGGMEAGLVYHFGYARQKQDMLYKLGLSEHKPEFRPGWWLDKYIANAQEDLHPVCKDGFWNAEYFDKERLPEHLRNHPYYNLEIIE
jgi:hypothetical protein